MLCFSFVLQFSCTLRAKIRWSRWVVNRTTTATWKIQSCTSTMATLCSMLRNQGTFTSPVELRVTVQNHRNFKSLCTEMGRLQIPRPMGRVLLRPLTRPFSGRFRFRPLPLPRRCFELRCSSLLQWLGFLLLCSWCEEMHFFDLVYLFVWI